MLEFAVVLIISLVSIAGAVLFGEDVEQTAAAMPIPADTETLVIVGRGVNIPSSSVKAVARGWVTLTLGTGTTAVVLTMYRGAQLGGDVIGQQTFPTGLFSKGDTVDYSIEYVETLENAGVAQYSMSVRQTGATGDGSALQALLDTKVLSG